MKKLLFIIACIIVAAHIAAAPGISFAAELKDSFTLSEIIAFGLRNNPQIAAAVKDTELGTFGVEAAVAEKMPRITLGGGVTRYDLPAPVSPITGSPLQGVAFPEFDRLIYDAGVSLTLPLYRGGRLDRAVTIAGLRKEMAEESLRLYRQELVFNLTSVYFKILQLEKLLAAHEETARQLEAHRKDVELFLRAGTVPRLDLLKTETELAHGRQGVILVRNSIDAAYDLLRTLMGIGDPSFRVSLVPEKWPGPAEEQMEKNIASAFSRRPDYSAMLKKQRAAEESLKAAEGGRLPSVNLLGEYTDRSGSGLRFHQNWLVALRFSLPVFDGGSIKAEVGRRRKEVEKAAEEERGLRSTITREIRDSLREIGNARERVTVTRAAIDSAAESLRVERLKYEAGAGTSREVIDAEAALLRAETDYHQAFYDLNIAQAFLKKAVGEDTYAEALQ